LTETPQALEENRNNYKSSSKWRETDVIAKLYAEALEKNQKLKTLNKNIQEINNDSLNLHTKAFSKYANINDNYWATATQYIGSINDSILRQQTTTLFKNSELNYRESIVKHKYKIEKIEKLTTILNDKLILMKLMVSQSMIKNYQVNEKPAIQELETLIQQYEVLIKETAEFTKIEK